MPTHNENEPKSRLWEKPESHGPEEVDASAGYEQTDASVTPDSRSANGTFPTL